MSKDLSPVINSCSVKLINEVIYAEVNPSILSVDYTYSVRVKFKYP